MVLSLLDTKLLPVSLSNCSYGMGPLAANLRTHGFFVLFLFSYLLVPNRDGSLHSKMSFTPLSKFIKIYLFGGFPP